MGLLAIMSILFVINFTIFILGAFKRFPIGILIIRSYNTRISIECHLH
jgi:hypothetical protein